MTLIYGLIPPMAGRNRVKDTGDTSPKFFGNALTLFQPGEGGWGQITPAIKTRLHSFSSANNLGRKKSGYPVLGKTQCFKNQRITLKVIERFESYLLKFLMNEGPISLFGCRTLINGTDYS